MKQVLHLISIINGSDNTFFPIIINLSINADAPQIMQNYTCALAIINTYILRRYVVTPPYEIMGTRMWAQYDILMDTLKKINTLSSFVYR